MKLGAFDSIGHHPSDQVAQQQMGVDFLDDSGRRMGTEVLDIQAMLPFSIDGLDLPAAMVEIDEFGVGISLWIVEGRQQPTGAEPRPLVTKQTRCDDVGQVGVFAAGGRCGMEFDHPLVVTESTPPFDITGLLIGEADEEMRPTQGNTPDGRIGKKSRGPSGPSRYAEIAA